MSKVAIFTKEMKSEYTIFMPTMLPVHFKFLESILKVNGYNVVLLDNCSDSVKECGLKYVHNDTCYPALLVIGQLIDAINNGGHDPSKVALLLSQTGGGCRASNYIALLRKALQKAGYENVPILSFNVGGLEKQPGFKITATLMRSMLYGVLCGDLLMMLRNQCKPYEINEGDTENLVAEWTEKLSIQLSKAKMTYGQIKKNYPKIIEDFAQIPMIKTDKVRVGIVGEIFVKFSPLGNNNLEDFLHNEGAEVVMAGLFDFCLYCVYNNMVDGKLFDRFKKKAFASKFIYNMMISKHNDLINAVKNHGAFKAPSAFAHTISLTKGYISTGVKMGEGWLLTAEMLELIENDVQNIVCTQPFGCLPNHIVGKGMMKPIKENHPDVNIVAIDYDPGATKINQENRIKLMLSNAVAAKLSKSAC